MKAFATVIVLAGLAIGGLVIYQQQTAKTPEQLEAQDNLDLLTQLEDAWTQHKSGPRGVSVLDPAQFDPLRAALAAVDVSRAKEDVQAVRERFIKLTHDAPQFLRMIGAPPEVKGGKALQREAMEKWDLEVRNAGIRVEVALREIKETLTQLKQKYGRIAAGPQ